MDVREAINDTSFVRGTTTEFRAATHALSGLSFDLEVLDPTNNAIAWDTILDFPWSSGEQVMVDLAWSLFFGRRGPTAMQLISSLDTHNFARALAAISIRRAG